MRPGKLIARHEWRLRLLLILTASLQKVGEIHAGRGDANLELSLARWRNVPIALELKAIANLGAHRCGCEAA